MSIIRDCMTTTKADRGRLAAIERVSGMLLLYRQLIPWEAFCESMERYPLKRFHKNRKSYQEKDHG